MNPTVFINGHNLGQHPYGYTSFWFDLTDKINFGGNNIIAVEVKNEGQNSRWYSGSGIYRHVWLKIADPVHIAQWGTAVTTTDVSTASAKVIVKTKVLNESDKDVTVKYVTHILNKANKELIVNLKEEKIKAGGSYDFDQTAVVDNPGIMVVRNTGTKYDGYRDILRRQLSRAEKNRFRHPQNIFRC